MVGRLSAIELDPDNGYRCCHLMMRMPRMIADRHIITTFYTYDDTKGKRVVVHSSQGNEELLELRREQIGNDVVANNLITYMESKPIEGGGMELNQVISIDVAGIIPIFVKKKLARHLAMIGLYTADYIMYETFPPKLF